MALQTPLPEGATLFLYRNEEGNADVIALAPGNEPERDIAWQAPDSTKDDFEWLARAAAEYHNINFDILEN